MKTILYIVAIVAIAAGGWFSYSTMATFKEKKQERIDLQKENANLKASIKAKKAEVADMIKQRKAAKEKRDNTQSDLSLAKENIGLAKKQIAAWQSKIDEQQEKLDGYAKTKAEIKKQFADQFNGRNVDLSEIPGLVAKLEEDLKKAKRKLEELQTFTEAADKRVAGNNTQIADLSKRMKERAERIRANKLQGTVTAVNHDWGFALVEVPSKMPVNEASELIVQRGSTFVGRLNITAIEKGRLVTDVDYKSMAPGLVVQPGDAVVLKKPSTN